MSLTDALMGCWLYHRQNNTTQTPILTLEGQCASVRQCVGSPDAHHPWNSLDGVQRNWNLVLVL